MKRESDRYYTAMELLKQYRQADRIGNSHLFHAVEFR